ncbi:MAG TPA: response regulator transcription factor [Thermomicrobiales bacterium]|nr:response regulator transcription factor [Thermomicrobiales bacterium]
MRVLVVDDEEQLAGIIGQMLERHGYAVDLAYDGLTGLDLALTGNYDAVVLDRMLPGMDGVDVCHQMRAAEVSTPVLILSARRELPERVEGLDAGADDYLGKPFALTELVARVRALTRRRDKPVVPDLLQAGDVTLHQQTHEVRASGRPVELSPKEYALLEYLLRNAGQVLSRDQILERVWGYDAEPEGNVVDLYIHYLRRKLDRNEAPSIIQTVRGVGYVIRDGEREA